MTTSDLPAVNAGLNGLAGVWLLAGFWFIKRGQVGRHRACMIGAFATSTVFLISYVAYHVLHGSTRFGQGGFVRYVYFAILISHVVLAAAVVPMAVVTLVRGLRGHVDRHKRLARWTFPIWMYVSVTGVLVYLMLYQWFA